MKLVRLNFIPGDGGRHGRILSHLICMLRKSFCLCGEWSVGGPDRPQTLTDVFHLACTELKNEATLTYWEICNRFSGFHWNSWRSGIRRLTKWQLPVNAKQPLPFLKRQFTLPAHLSFYPWQVYFLTHSNCLNPVSIQVCDCCFLLSSGTNFSSPTPCLVIHFPSAHDWTRRGLLWSRQWRGEA